MKFLLTSDWHLRSDTPISRIDDFQQIQIDSLKFISKIAKENDAYIICAGDIFHKPKDNIQELINQLHDIFENQLVYYICGQHDLLYHSLENFEKCNIGLLEKFHCFSNSTSFLTKEEFINIDFYDYGKEIKNSIFVDSAKIKMAVWHKYCEDKELPFYIKDGINAEYLIDNYNYDVFVTGDNHRSFVYEKNNKFVFNCGCLTRQNLNEKDYECSCILFDTITGKYEKILLPDNKLNVFKEENLVKQLERESRLTSFIELVNSNKGVSFSFKDNLAKYCKENTIQNEIVNIIEEILE